MGKLPFIFKYLSLLLTIFSISIIPCPEGFAERMDGLYPWHLSDTIAGDGKYLISKYSADIAIWDLDRLWDFIQPTLVHVLIPKKNYLSDIDYWVDKSIAVSDDGNWIAYEENKSIKIFQMKRGFQLSHSIKLNGDCKFLNLSPDGNLLLVLEDNHLKMIKLEKESKHSVDNKYKWDGGRIFRVDWLRDKIAILKNDEIKLLRLSELEVINKIKKVPSGINKIVFTMDDEHMLVAWEIKSKDSSCQTSITGVSKINIGSDLSLFGEIKVVEKIKTIIPGENSRSFWYTDNFRIAPVGKSGEIDIGARLLPECNFDNFGKDFSIIAVLQNKKYIIGLEKRKNIYIVFDLDTSIPLFSLSARKVKYVKNGSNFSHLPPKWGSMLLLENLDKMCPKACLRFSSSSYNFLLRYAHIITRLRKRYDKIWFLLLTELKNTEEMDHVYSQLSMLCYVQIKFITAENLIKYKNNELALKYIQEAIKALRNVKKNFQPTEESNMKKPKIEVIISTYRNILEREGWLLLGNTLINLNRIRDAEIAYLEVLKHEPRDWRAYSGLLEVNLRGGNVKTFDALLEKAQKELRMEGWVDYPPFGYPNQFFNENELLLKRSNLKK